MSFGGGGGGGGTLNTASDVALSNIAANQYLQWNSSTSKWNNTGLEGNAALATGGGSETVQSPAWSATQALNLANANVFSVVLGGNTTFTFSGATASRACSFTLYIRQDATGNRTVTWPASVRWAGGIAPTVSTGANQLDILVFETISGGASWYGSLVGNNFS